MTFSVCSLVAQDIRIRLATELAKTVAADSLESDVGLVSLDTELQVVGVMISRGQLGQCDRFFLNQDATHEGRGLSSCCCYCYY